MTSLAFIVASVLVLLCPAGRAAADSPVHFDHPTKLLNLETGYVLGPGGAGKVGFGDSGFGVKGRMQFTTNTLLDILTFVNGQVKVKLVEDEGPLPAVAVGFGYYNLVSSEYIIDTAVREAFADKDMDLRSGLECYYLFLSVSKRVNSRTRLHAGYQYRYLEGFIDSDRPFDLSSERDTVSIYLSLDQSAEHRGVMAACDIDIIDRLKILLELGYDASYDKARGGAGMRLGLFQTFNLQLGILWPGIKLDDDIEVPVLPHFSMFWRF